MEKRSVRSNKFCVIFIVLIKFLIVLVSAKLIDCTNANQRHQKSFASDEGKFGTGSTGSSGLNGRIITNDPLTDQLHHGDQANGIESSGDTSRRRTTNQNLDDFLDSLPILSIGVKHKALFECELDGDLSKFKLIWLKLTSRSISKRIKSPELSLNNDNRAADDDHNSTSASINYDTKLLSLNWRLITPDKRFKVSHQPPNKWMLSIENVAEIDDRAWYLCQASGSTNDLQAAGGSRFIGGAKLNVLGPPKIIENETSASAVTVNEFEQVQLRCKTIGEPQAQIIWRREDGHSLDGLEQRFRHQSHRRPNQILSIDSSELIFEAIGRHQAGAYLCIASNGILSGVSQRIGVTVVESSSSPQSSNCSGSTTLQSTAATNNFKCDESPTATGNGKTTDNGPTIAKRKEEPKKATSEASSGRKSSGKQLTTRGRGAWRLSSTADPRLQQQMGAAAANGHRTHGSPSAPNQQHLQPNSADSSNIKSDRQRHQLLETGANNGALSRLVVFGNHRPSAILLLLLLVPLLVTCFNYHSTPANVAFKLRPKSFESS